MKQIFFLSVKKLRTTLIGINPTHQYFQMNKNVEICMHVSLQLKWQIKTIISCNYDNKKKNQNRTEWIHPTFKKRFNSSRHNYSTYGI